MSGGTAGCSGLFVLLAGSECSLTGSEGWFEYEGGTIVDRVDDVIQKRGEGIHGVEWEGVKIGVNDGETMAGCCGRVDVWAGHLGTKKNPIGFVAW